VSIQKEKARSIINIRDKGLIVVCGTEKARINWLEKKDIGYQGGVSFLHSNGHSIWNFKIKDGILTPTTCALYKSVLN
jgi:hypothetical protein